MGPLPNAGDPGRLSDSGFSGLLKHATQWSLRSLHLVLLRKPLPRRVALYFHHLDDATVAALEALFSFFKQRDYAFVNAETYHLDSGSDRRLVFLSFDDNYSSWYDYRSLLTRHQIKAAFYCNSLPLDRKPDDPVVVEYYRRLGSPADQRPLSSMQLRELAESGHDIGCHTHSHLNLAALDPETLKQEIESNRQIIESAVGARIVDFSFPFGQPRHFPSNVQDVVRKAGFTRVAHATSGMQYAPPTPGTIHRSLWRPEKSFDSNLAELCADGQWFVRLAGRSALG